MVERVDVLCNYLSEEGVEKTLLPVNNKKIRIHRCWQYDSPITFLRIIKLVSELKPDVIWFNLSYTIMGKGLVASLLCTLLPPLFKLKGVPTIVLLHNFITAVKLQDLDLPLKIPRRTLLLIDTFVLKCLSSVDRIVVMAPWLKRELLSLIPKEKIQIVNHDVCSRTEKFIPVNMLTKTILTIGYFGTYKKLESLLIAFSNVLQEFPEAKLLIAGTDSPHTAGYLEELQIRFKNQLKHVVFLGYVDTLSLEELFLSANVVVITNSTSTDSSGVIAYCKTFGRPILVPEELDDFYELPSFFPRVLVTYKLSSADELAQKLITFLVDTSLQNRFGEMMWCSYEEARTSSFAGFHHGLLSDLGSTYPKMKGRSPDGHRPSA